MSNALGYLMVFLGGGIGAIAQKCAWHRREQRRSQQIAAIGPEHIEHGILLVGLAGLRHSALRAGEALSLKPAGLKPATGYANEIGRARIP